MSSTRSPTAKHSQSRMKHNGVNLVRTRENKAFHEEAGDRLWQHM